jgi:hypothetical protein
MLKKFLRISGAYLPLGVLLLETSMASFGMKIEGFAAYGSLIYLLSGLLLSYLIVRLPQPVGPTLPGVQRWQPVMGGLLILLTGVIGIITAKGILASTPISVTDADMLPVMKVLNQRVLQGHWQRVYDPVPEIWNGTRPIYLPALWLPFAPAVYFGFDMRWVTVCALLIAFGLYFGLIRTVRSLVYLLLAGSGLILFCWLFLQDEYHGLISLSEEGVVILYYVLLVIALERRHAIGIGCAALLCLLSRYALAGWIPAYLLYLVALKQFRTLKIFVFVILGGLLLLLLLPFGLENGWRLVHLPEAYIPFSLRVWKDSPGVFTDGLGLARYYMPAYATGLHGTLIALSFLLPAVFVIACLVSGKKINRAHIPLASLKLALVIFFNWIDVPYLYLFYTSSFVSLIAVSGLYRSTERHADRIKPGEA